MTIAHFIAQTLRSSGLDVIFGYPGQSNLALLHAIADAGLRYVQSADERAAAFAASGHAEVTGRPGIVCVSKGPAVTNLVTPLVGALKDGVPMLALTGNVTTACSNRNSFQDFDASGGLFRVGAIKAGRHCARAQDVPMFLDQMLRAAWAAPAGPTLLDLPEDVLTAPTTATPSPIAWNRREVRMDQPELAVAIAATRLLAAHRPLMIVGRGARRDSRLVRACLDRYGWPAVHTMGGTGVVPTTSVSYGGLLRHNGSATAARLVQTADVILALGTGLDDRATAKPASFAPQATIIHVDVDEAVLARQRATSLGVRCSVECFLTTMTSMTPSSASSREWHLDAPVMAPSDEVVDARPVGALSARQVVRTIASVLAGAIVVKDSGSHKYWVTNHGPCFEPDESVASCHFGSMGFALPAAIGASIGAPTRRVIAICGDGGLMMSLCSMPTAIQERCSNLKIVVFNNAGLGSTRDYEHRAAPNGRCLSDFTTHLPFGAFARAFGIQAHRIVTAAELAALPSLLATDGLMLCDCVLDPREAMSPSISYLAPLETLASTSVACASRP